MIVADVDGQHQRHYGDGVTDHEDAGTSPGELERALNEAAGPRWVYWDLRDAAVGAEVVVRYTKSEMGRDVLSGVLLLGDVVTADMLRKVPVSSLENSANMSRVETALDTELEKLPPLERGDLGPDEFSRLVAEHYRVWAMFVAHPAAAMAERANVKAPTMHTWIREARLRGHLPPARRGKAT